MVKHVVITHPFFLVGKRAEPLHESGSGRIECSNT